MKIVASILAIISVTTLGYIWTSRPQPKLFQITPVSTAADAEGCGKDGGMGARLAHLDDSGNVVSDWSLACVREVK